MPVPISAFIITKNEEARLSATIAALKPLVNEVLVVDSGSTDRTVEIARSHGAVVIHRDWNGYGSQKRFAEQNCRNQWVLNVDADEVLTPGLANEIKALFSGPSLPEIGAYRTRILTVYPGDMKPRLFANDYNVVRLYHRDIGSFRDHPVFDRVVLQDVSPKQLQAPIYHHPYISFDHVNEKHNRYSSFRSSNSEIRPRRLLELRLLSEFPVNFIKFYLFRRHFTGGWKGFYFSLCYALMRTSRIAKMLERSCEALPPPRKMRIVSSQTHYRKAS